MTIFVPPSTASSSTSDLGGGGVAVGHAHVGGRQHGAVFVGHGFGVDESLVVDDLSVLAGEPHLHRPVRGLDLHRHQSRAADADVHLGDGDGGAVGAVPRGEVLAGRSTSAR